MLIIPSTDPVGAGPCARPASFRPSFRRMLVATDRLTRADEVDIAAYHFRNHWPGMTIKGEDPSPPTHAACQMITTMPMNNKTAPAVFCQVISSSPFSHIRARSRENSGAVYTMGAMIDTSP